MSGLLSASSFMLFLWEPGFLLRPFSSASSARVDLVTKTKYLTSTPITKRLRALKLFAIVATVLSAGGLMVGIVFQALKLVTTDAFLIATAIEIIVAAISTLFVGIIALVYAFKVFSLFCSFVAPSTLLIS